MTPTFIKNAQQPSKAARVKGAYIKVKPIIIGKMPSVLMIQKTCCLFLSKSQPQVSDLF